MDPDFKLTTVTVTDPEFPRIQARRKALMDARQIAVKARDWQTMNDLTHKLAKLPTPIARAR